METSKFCSPSVIQKTLSAHGFHFSKARGQNFLINPHVPRRMAELVPNGTGVLEIGPGFGSLTAALCDTAEKVLALEVDSRLVPLLRENLSDRDNLVIIEQDALKVNISELLDKHLTGLNLMAVCNLPYSVTADMLSLLIETASLSSFIVMVQREVALRVTACPGTADYGSFSVFSQVFGQANLLFDVSPGSFIPVPGVTSTVFQWTRRSAPLVEKSYQKLFFQIVRGSFSQRRKTLRNSLNSALPISKDSLGAIFSRTGIDPSRRGETLSVDEFLLLTKEVQERHPDLA